MCFSNKDKSINAILIHNYKYLIGKDVFLIEVYNELNVKNNDFSSNENQPTMIANKIRKENRYGPDLRKLALFYKEIELSNDKYKI